MGRLVEFFYEAGMLARTPRTGYQFLGTGSEDVAAHSHRAAIIAYALAAREGANPERAAMLCLFHDLHEARTGDFNYVNKLYNTCDAPRAEHDAIEGTGLEPLLAPLLAEMAAGETPEARVAHDADQLDFICRLREEEDLGNRRATKWLTAAVQRVHTATGRELAEAIRTCDPTDWWFARPDASHWTRNPCGCESQGAAGPEPARDIFGDGRED